MITVAKAKEILGNTELTDQEISRIVDLMAALATLSFELLQVRNKQNETLS